MEVLIAILKMRIGSRLEWILTQDSIYSLVVAFFMAAISLLLLIRGSKEKDALYTFSKKEYVPVLLWQGLALFVLSPVLPVNGSGILGVLSMMVCLIILGVTAVVDEKCGGFRLGYVLVGVLLELVLWVGSVCMGEKGALQGVFRPTFICLLLILIVGIAFSLADRGLLCVSYLMYMILLEKELWIASVIITLFVAMLICMLRFLWELPKRRREEGFWKKRRPATLAIFIGVLITLFLVR